MPENFGQGIDCRCQEETFWVTEMLCVHLGDGYMIVSICQIHWLILFIVNCPTVKLNKIKQILKIVKLTFIHRKIGENKKFHSFSGRSQRSICSGRERGKAISKEVDTYLHSLVENKNPVQKRIVILLTRK